MGFDGDFFALFFVGSFAGLLSLVNFGLKDFLFGFG